MSYSDTGQSVLALIVGLLVGSVIGYMIGGSDEARMQRRLACSRELATLVADTLCVRPDSSWRVK